MEFDRGIWEATKKLFPQEYRLAIFYTTQKRKKSIEVRLFAIVDGVKIRLDCEIPWETLNSVSGDDYEQGCLFTTALFEILKENIEAGAISRIREFQNE